MRARTLLFLAVLATLMGCSSKRITSKSSIYYERTACYGTCPIYDMTIRGNRLVTLNGNRFTEKIGQWKLQLTKEETRTLFNAVQDIRWDTLKPKYDSGVSDFPSTILSINHRKMADTVVITGVHIPSLDSSFAHLNQLVKGHSDRWKQVGTAADPVYH